MFSKFSQHLGEHADSAMAHTTPEAASLNIPALAIGADAHYFRVDNHLTIQVAGEKIVLTDYFLHPQPLSTAQGETLSVSQVQAQLLSSPVLVADNSNSAPLEKIGTVDIVLKTAVEAKGIDGAIRTLKQGDPVYLHDTITTPVGGYVKIILHDGTVFQLGPFSRATLDKYSYDPNHVNAGGHFETTVAAGIFRFVSGKISGNNQGQHTVIKTPSAVIGIRGSELDIHVNPDGSVVIVHTSGFVDVTPSYHPTQHLSLFEHGTTVYIPADAGMPTIGVSPPQFIQEFRNQLLPLNPYAPAPAGSDALRHEGHGFDADPKGDPNRPFSPLDDRLGHGDAKEPPPGQGHRPLEFELAKDHPEFRPPLPDDIGKAHWIMAGKNIWLDTGIDEEHFPPQGINPLDRSFLDQVPPPPLQPKEYEQLRGLLNPILDKIEHRDEIGLPALDPNKPLPFAIFTEDNAVVTQKLVTPAQAEFVTLIQPKFGTVINNYDGTFTYRPNSIDFTGEDSFSYRVEAIDNLRSARPVTLSPGINDFTNVTVTVPPLTVFNLDTISNFTQPLHGSLVTDAVTGAVNYIPSQRNFSGDDSFSYLLKTSDTDPGTWVQADILVTHVNNEPVAVADSFNEVNPIIPNKAELLTTLEDNALTITQEVLLKNDTDVDTHDVLLVLRVESVSPSDGLAADIATHGSVYINPQGNIIYTPDPDYNGQATFKYTVVDNLGARSSTFVTLNVLPVNDAPVTKVVTLALDGQNIINVPSPVILANTTDVDNPPSDLRLVSVSDALHGQVSLTADNRVVFIPDAVGNAFVTGEFSYTVTDGQLNSTGRAIVVESNTSLLKPQAIADIVQLSSSTQATLLTPDQLLLNDIAPVGRILKITAVSEGVNATVELTSTGNIQITPSADAGNLGVAGFKYTVSDDLGNTDVGVVAVNLPKSNLVAHDDLVNLGTETSLKIPASSLLSNDVNLTGDALHISSLGTALKGTVSLDSNNDVIFTRSADFNGAGAFSYQVSNTQGESSIANVVIAGDLISTVLQLPQANPDRLGSQAKNQPITIPVSQLLANDTDPSDSSAVLSVQRVLLPVHGSVQLDSSNQHVIFTPDANYVGSAGFTYVINNGSRISLPTLVTMDIVNAAPQAQAVTGINAAVNTPIQIAAKDILASVTDPDKGDILVLQSVSNPLNGSAVLTPEGDVLFTPNKDYQGAASFQYTVADSSQATSSSTVEVNVSSGLIANADSFSLPKNVSSTLVAKDLLANDVAINPTDTLNIVAVTQPAHGTLTLLSSGDISFTPETGFSGKTAFQYTVTDNNGHQSLANVALDIANRPPVAQPDTFTEATNTSTVSIKVTELLVNDSDPDGDALKITAVTNLSNGDVRLDAVNGIINFIPNAQVSHGGVASFNYTLDDGAGGTTQGTVNLSFGQNQPPVVTLSNSSTLSYHLGDSALTIDAAAQITDPDTLAFNQGLLKISLRNPLTGDSLEIHNLAGISTVDPSGGALVFAGKNIGSFSTTASELDVQLNGNADTAATTALLQAVTYKNTTANNSAGSAPTGIRTLDITLTDGDGGTSALVSRDINVQAVEQPPTAVADTVSKPFGVVTSITGSELLGNDVNPNPSSLLTITNISNFSAGVNARLVNNDVQLFIDALTGNNQASFDYSISNGSGTSSTSTVTIQADNVINGTANADTLNNYNKSSFVVVNGLDGNDIFGASNGAAKLFGGAGNDTFIFDPSASAGVSIDGGTGSDTVSLNNATGKSLDLIQNSSLPADQQYVLRNIETLNIAAGSGASATGNNTLRLSISDVLNITENKSLIVDGNAGSVVISPGQGWQNQGTQTIGAAVYTHYSAGGADLLVSNEINAQFIS